MALKIDAYEIDQSSNVKRASRQTHFPWYCGSDYGYGTMNCDSIRCKATKDRGEIILARRHSPKVQKLPYVPSHAGHIRYVRPPHKNQKYRGYMSATDCL